MLYLEYGLPIQVRDAALKIKDELPKSDVNREYYLQNVDSALANSASIGRIHRYWLDPTAKQKKGEKKTFYCQTCFIDLNSIDAYLFLRRVDGIELNEASLKLHDKIKETRDPVVGLDNIKEYIAVSDPEIETHYECDL